ncbi:MAG: hypothetical protein Q8J76_07805 [Desulfobulbaceae bacterium]|nr:hypothetical protein [Desulfobulbaceae bacterium]
MAKIKTKGIISRVRGRLGAIDRTVGVEGGLSCNFTERRGGMTLTSKKAMTRGGSEARHERSRVYCACDTEYKKMFETKREDLNGYYRQAHDLDTWTLTDYMTWMKLCLTALPEKAAFREFSWLARYKIQNTSGEIWTDKIVRLIDVDVKRSDGKDLQVFKLDLHKNIISEIDHKIDTPGSTLVKIPFLDIEVSFFADVYSYSEYQHWEAW